MIELCYRGGVLEYPFRVFPVPQSLLKVSVGLFDGMGGWESILR
jgi:hypothetical protein